MIIQNSAKTLAIVHRSECILYIYFLGWHSDRKYA